jgi:hypothetical protein
MKIVLVLLLLALLMIPASAITRALVFEFAVDGVNHPVGKEAASYLATAIAYLDGFEVVDPNITQKLCDNEKVESYDVDVPTAVKIAQNPHANGANLAALGKVEKDGSSYKVTVTYVNTVDGTIIATKSATGSGIYSLSRSIDKIVGLLE